MIRTTRYHLLASRLIAVSTLAALGIGLAGCSKQDASNAPGAMTGSPSAPHKPSLPPEIASEFKNAPH